MIIGIDIGTTGAIARLTEDGELIDVSDMPCLHDGPAGRRAINAPLLAEMIRGFGVEKISIAFIEYVGARPGEGAVGAFAFGRSRGVIEGVIGTIGIPARWMTPPIWKRIVCLPVGKERAKDASRSEAVRRWPAMAKLFSRVKDNGRSDAALIGLAGILKFHNGLSDDNAI